MNYFSYIPADYSLRNSLQKAVFSFLQANDRKIIPADEAEEFKKGILTGIKELNSIHPKCHPVQAHWENQGVSKGDFTLWIGVGIICRFHLYLSKN